MTAGGKERRLTELMKSLRSRPDIQFELAMMTHDIHYKEILELGIDIHFLIRKRKKDFAVFRSFYTLCKNYRPDIVHCWDTMTAVYITPVCKLLHIKLVNGMVVDSPQNQSIFFQPYLRARLTFPFADIIIGNSNSGLKAYKASPKKSITIYNGFNFERIKNILPKEILRTQFNITTEFVVGMVATFSEYKDYPTYYKAAHKVLSKRQDITFLAIGKDTDSTKSKSYIEKVDSDNFRLIGKQSDIESFVNLIDIGVLSTFTEGISNSILEYMALGKPVIATSGGGTDEIVDDQKTGLLVSTSNPDELAEKIELLIDNPKLRFDMGKSGKERIQRLFSIEVMTEKYLSAYRELLLK